MRVLGYTYLWPTVHPKCNVMLRSQQGADRHGGVRGVVVSRRVGWPDAGGATDVGAGRQAAGGSPAAGPAHTQASAA